jgi:hypothetical protein
MDVWYFFSIGIDIQGDPPQSLLCTTYREVASSIIQAHLNMPYAELMGQDSSDDSKHPMSDEQTKGALDVPTHPSFHPGHP